MTNPVSMLGNTKVPDEGEIVEFGCFDGSSTKILAERFPSRKVYAFDTFCGMPSAERGYIKDLDHSDPPGKHNAGKSVSEIYKSYPTIIPVVGVYEDTLKTQTEPHKIALAYIDCDWYISHVHALEWIETKLIPQSVVLFDDPNLKGARKAIDEWCVKHNRTLNGKIIIW